jgi:hypothetical protein
VLLWLFALVVVPAIIGAVLVVVGTRLPPGFVRARRATFARPSAEVWRVISDLEAHPRWRTNMVGVERLGPTRFREVYRHGAITYAIDVDEAPVRRVHRIADPAMPFGGRFIYELAIAGNDTELTVTEDGIVQNPGFRVFSRWLSTAAIDRFLLDLGKHLGVPVAIETAQPSPLVA